MMPLFFRWSSMSDEQLMQKAKEGSEHAFGELYNRHARRLQGFFARRLGSDGDLAADFMHDTFLRLYSSRHKYHSGSNFRAWLYTIAYNLVKNHFRSRLVWVNDERVGVADDTDVEVDMDEAMLKEALSKVLASMAEPYAMLFSLHYEEELTIPQIAKMMSLPEGTVKSRLHKTMKLIKQQLKEYENH